MRSLERVWTVLLRHRGGIADIAVALLAYGLFIGTIRSVIEPPESLFHAATGWPEYLAAALITLPIAVRRRWPLTGLVLVTGGALLFHSLHPVNLFVPHAAFLFAVYNAGRYGRPRARDVTRAAVLVAAIVNFAFADVPAYVGDPAPYRPLAVVVASALVGAGWFLGDVARRAHERERDLAARTAELAARTAELEVERERSARQAATEERLRIARELHDVLGHHVSLMGVQAAGARLALPPGAERSREALAAIEHASRQTVTEMQRMLALLRSDGEDGARRMPGLAHLDELASELRDAGVDATVAIASLPELPASVELAAVRVVQESWTNVLRHAGPGTSSQARISLAEGALHVVVEDDGRGQPPDGQAHLGTGRGLVGMRERVELHGGEFEAGPLPSGGFRVRAVLPLTGADGPARATPRLQTGAGR